MFLFVSSSQRHALLLNRRGTHVCEEVENTRDLVPWKILLPTSGLLWAALGTILSPFVLEHD